MDVVSLGCMYKLATVMCFELLMCTLPICRSVLCVLKVKGMSVRVTLMLSLMSEKPTSIFILTYLLNDVTARRFNVLYGRIINFPNLPSGRNGFNHF